MGMYGSGVLTLGTITMKMRQQMAVCGRIIILIIIDCCGAVLGAAIPVTVVVHIAAETSRIMVAYRVSVFGWYVVRRELYSH
jgi:hypothetical protein